MKTHIGNAHERSVVVSSQAGKTADNRVSVRLLLLIYKPTTIQYHKNHLGGRKGGEKSVNSNNFRTTSQREKVMNHTTSHGQKVLPHENSVPSSQGSPERMSNFLFPLSSIHGNMNNQRNIRNRFSLLFCSVSNDGRDQKDWAELLWWRHNNDTSDGPSVQRTPCRLIDWFKRSNCTLSNQKKLSNNSHRSRCHDPNSNGISLKITENSFQSLCDCIEASGGIGKNTTEPLRTKRPLPIDPECISDLTYQGKEVRSNSVWRETVASHTCKRTDHSVLYDTRCSPWERPLFHAVSVTSFSFLHRKEVTWNSGKPYVQAYPSLSILWHTLLATIPSHLPSFVSLSLHHCISILDTKQNLRSKHKRIKSMGRLLGIKKNVQWRIGEEKTKIMENAVQTNGDASMRWEML